MASNPFIERKRQECVKDVVRQITHPKTGMSKNMFCDASNVPKILQEWLDVLDTMNGWVTAGVKEDIADMMKLTKIGEIIPAVNSDLGIYSNNFAMRTIFKTLEVDSRDKNWKVILSYDSFIKLAMVVQRYLKGDDLHLFHKAMEDFIKKIDPKTFWMIFPISDKISHTMKSLGIGEVVIAECEINFFNIDSSNDMEEKDQGNTFTKNAPYRFIINQDSILRLIHQALRYTNRLYNLETNVFEALGGHEKDLASMFSKMTL